MMRSWGPLPTHSQLGTLSQPDSLCPRAGFRCPVPPAEGAAGPSWAGRAWDVAPPSATHLPWPPAPTLTLPAEGAAGPSWAEHAWDVALFSATHLPCPLPLPSSCPQRVLLDWDRWNSPADEFITVVSPSYSRTRLRLLSSHAGSPHVSQGNLSKSPSVSSLGSPLGETTGTRASCAAWSRGRGVVGVLGGGGGVGAARLL
jgi:hypothetical protein